MTEQQVTAIRRQIFRLAVEIEQGEAHGLCPGRIEVLEALLAFQRRRLEEVAREGAPVADCQKRAA